MTQVFTKYNPLPEKDRALVERMRSRYSLRTIADRTGIGYYRILAQFDPKGLQDLREARSKYHRTPRIKKPQRVRVDATARFEIPVWVIEDRNRRASIRLEMPANELIMGDPLPGYSALDRRK